MWGKTICTRFSVFGYTLAVICTLFAVSGCKTTERVNTRETAETRSERAETRDSLALGIRDRVIYLRDTVTITETVTEYGKPIAVRDTVLVPVERVIYRAASSGASQSVTARDTVYIRDSDSVTAKEHSDQVQVTKSERTTDDKSGGYLVLIVIVALLGLLWLIDKKTPDDI